MSTRASKHIRASAGVPSAPVAGGLLQRTPACGDATGFYGEYTGCGKQRLQRQEAPGVARGLAPPIVHDVLHSHGAALNPVARGVMEARLGHDFSRVRVHDDSRAAASAQAVNALAYTVGQHIVFGPKQYSPESAEGQRLIAHELAHVIQQDGAGSNGSVQRELAISQPGDALEQEAGAIARRVVAGAPAPKLTMSAVPAVQRETPGGEQKPEEKKDAGDVVAEGMQTVAKQATDNNSQVKKVIIGPIKDRLKGEWGRLNTGEKAATVSFGVGALGLAGGALLADPAGRKRLEGVNLAAPLTLIPYMPLTSFKVLPSGEEPDKRLFKFETGFNADDLINIRAEARRLPKMSLKARLEWGYDPVSDRLRVLGGNASFGLVPGLSLSAGAYKDVLPTRQIFTGPEGQLEESKKTVPQFGKAEARPDVRIMLTVDLLKFKPGDLRRQLRSIFLLNR